MGLKNPFKDWFEIFRAGTHTDSLGKIKDWSEEELKLIADNYNKGEHEAPIVIGHPKDNTPAYGWIDKLMYKAGVLYAKAKDDIIPEFVDAVEKGLYKKRSISLYPDNTLRHLGFLGGMPPAIKGMEDLQFNNDNSFDTYEFSVADEKVDEPEETADTAQQLSQSDEQRKKAEENLEKLSLKLRLLEFQQYLNERVAYGSLKPAQVRMLTKLLEALDTIDLSEHEGEQVFAFTEYDNTGKANTTYANPVNILKQFVDTLPKQIPSTMPVNFTQEERTEHMTELRFKYPNASENELSALEEAKQIEREQHVSFEEALNKVSQRRIRTIELQQ